MPFLKSSDVSGVLRRDFTTCNCTSVKQSRHNGRSKEGFHLWILECRAPQEQGSTLVQTFEAHILPLLLYVMYCRTLSCHLKTKRTWKFLLSHCFYAGAALRQILYSVSRSDIICCSDEAVFHICDLLYKRKREAS